jgi:acyl-CoA synthetase (AMP-forming)/AMP-acid ligase II
MRLLKPDAFPSLKYSFFCGEPLTVKTAKLWKSAAPGSTMVNLYGPTEATIAISRYQWVEDQPLKEKNGVVSIGKVFDPQEYRIFSDAAQEGQLLLHGSQVITNYYNDEQSDATQFLTFDNSPSKRWYKTGDIVEMDDDLDLFYIGRVDDEVKISGYRVNLLEIDHLISKFCNPVSVATVYQKEGNKDQIISFIQLFGGAAVSELEVVNLCRENLPWYMVPEKVIFVDSMPLNDNGKVDKKKLKQQYPG